MGTASNSLPVSGGIPPVPLPSKVEKPKLSTIKMQICNSITCQPDVISHLADELDCLGLIPVTVQQSVKYTQGRSPYEKADAMIAPVMERVRNDPTKFAPALMRALNKVGLGYVITESDLLAAGKSGC